MNDFKRDELDHVNPYADDGSLADPNDPSPEVTGEEMQKLGLFEFWSKLTFAPKRFFLENYRDRQTPYFALAIIVFSLAAGIERVDQTLVKQIAKGNGPAVQQMIGTWPAYVAAVAFSGALAGAFYYLFGGWFYNVRIGWAGGEKNADRAKFLYLYSCFLPSLVGILFKLIEIATNPESPMEAILSDEGLSALLFGLIAIASLYGSVYISYRGVRETTTASRGKARVWFLILPAIFYTMLIGLVAIIFALIEIRIPAG